MDTALVRRLATLIVDQAIGDDAATVTAAERERMIADALSMAAAVMSIRDDSEHVVRRVVDAFDRGATLAEVSAALAQVVAPKES